MPSTLSTQMGFPRFRGTVRNLILLMTAIYVTLLLLRASERTFPLAKAIFDWGVLRTPDIKAWWIWQFLTYGFLHDDPLNFLFSMLAIYFLGSAVQERIGSRAFLEMFLTSLIGAGVLSFLISLSGLTSGPVMGSGPAGNAILMVFFLLNRDAPIMLLPLPIPIPVKYIVIFTAAVEGAYFLIYQRPLYYAALLLGLAAGYFWYRFLWRSYNMSRFFQTRITSLKNFYYRRKREQAKKKFQVYMRKHEQDPKQYFDEYGNFLPPEEKDKKNGSPGGWVN